MSSNPAFVSTVAPFALRSQSSSWTGVRPALRHVAPVNRRAVICAVAPIQITGKEFDEVVLQAVRCLVRERVAEVTFLWPE